MISEPDFFGKRALVADDYPASQEMFQEMLELLGFNVDVADDGERALEMYNKNFYDVILMDIKMPIKNGYEVTEDIRRIEKNKRHTVIVALTANAMAGDKERCFAAGMDAYFTKPADIRKLRSILSDLLLNKKSE